MYPNPYMMSSIPKAGLFSRSLSALKTVKWSSLLEGTQKTLGVINQAIPVVYQIKPIFSNAKAIFKIAGAMKDDEIKQPINKTKTPPPPTTSPIFYI